MAGYVIYLRKSRADLEMESRGEGETLARHRAALLEVAKRQGLSVTQIYSEIVSGETIAARPVIQKLLSEVEQGMWTGVLVMEIERLARGDTIDQGVVAQAFKFSGTKIITPVKVYDPGNEFDEEYFEFGLFMSRREYKTITRRMQRGRLASVKEGKFAANKAPYGYKRVRLEKDKGWTLEPVPEQAEAVQLIFDWYVNGEKRADGTQERLGYLKIAQKLDAMKLPTVTGGSWSVGTVKEILTNPTYIGKVRWNHRPQVKHISDGKIIMERPRSGTDETIIADGIHPPIITQELFETAQTYFRMRLESPVPHGKMMKNPLAKIVVCGICGKAMVRRPYANGYPDTLICNTRNCSNVSTQLQYVEKRILFLLEDWLGKYKLELDGAEPVPNNMELQAKKQSVIRLKSDLAKLEIQSDHLHDLLEQGIYTIEVFTERSRKIALKTKANQDRLQELELEIKAYEDHSQQKEQMIPKVERILELYQAASDSKEKNDLLKEVLEKAAYIKTKNGHKKGNEPDDFELTIYPLLPKQPLN